MSEINEITEVETGQVKVAKAPAKLRCSALGSCVAVILHDSQHKVGGIAHVMLPTTDMYIKGDDLLLYTEYAVKTLIKQLLKLGAERSNIKAKLVGGALVVADSTNVGLQNIEAVVHKLMKENIEIVGRHVGGRVSMHATLDVGTGTVWHAETGKVDKKL